VGVMAGSALLHFSGHYDLSIITVSGVAFLGFIISLGLNPPKVFSENR